MNDLKKIDWEKELLFLIKKEIILISYSIIISYSNRIKTDNLKAKEIKFTVGLLEILTIFKKALKNNLKSIMQASNSDLSEGAILKVKNYL